MKKCAASVLSLLAMVSVTACAPASSPASAPQAGAAVELPNPFVSHASLREAREAFGAPFPVPAVLPAGFHPMDMSVAAAGSMPMAQVLYEHGDQQILYRVVRGVGEGDRRARITAVSGDYHAYKDAGTLTAGALQVDTRGQDGRISVAYWERDGYSYCLVARPGLLPEQTRILIESIGF